MLIKEYRIPLPLTVEEYQIAQLYMIAKKSREVTKGAGSGVEILINEPYSEGPGGSGQYTKKIYHVGSHLPGWFKSILPTSALTVEEEAWNAYPNTKTRYTCPFVQKFSLEIDTYYCADDGHQENVFQLTGSDLRNRVVDVIDVVKDQLHGADYLQEQDPRFYVSEKTGRGPLNENWIKEHWDECKNQTMPTPNGKAIMCSYKLCRVEFHYWGMQSKIEKYIHDSALRKTMLEAHRQAWAWQDEWFGLTMADIREIEKETAETLKKKMAANDDPELENDDETEDDTSLSRVSAVHQDNSSESNSLVVIPENALQTQGQGSHQSIRYNSSSEESVVTKSAETLSLKHVENLSTQWRMESLFQKNPDSEPSDDDQFFDCPADKDDGESLTKWSSLEIISPETDNGSITEKTKDASSLSQPFSQKITSERKMSQKCVVTKASEESLPGSPTLLNRASSSCATTCKTTVLCLVVHGGSALDATSDFTANKSDIITFKGAFESVMRQHYSAMVGHIAIELIQCPPICTDALGILTSLSPYSSDQYITGEKPRMTHESVAIGAIPLLSTTQQEYSTAVVKTVRAANKVYQEFLKSEEGLGFCGQIIIIGDSMGSLLAYDALTCHSHSGQYANEDDQQSSSGHGFDTVQLQASCGQTDSSRRRSSSPANDYSRTKLDFDASDFFMFGSPLSLVLAHRKVHSEDKQTHLTRPAQQIYNLFHPTDPLAARLEPLLSARFAAIAPLNVARYSKYPLGDGQPYNLLECIQCNRNVFSGTGNGPLTPISTRRYSGTSIQSGMSGLVGQDLQAINKLQQKWWGDKRIDYALYCPEALASFPVHSLPHLFHASYWESTDAIAFILRQITSPNGESSPIQSNKEDSLFFLGQPREKWMKKRTSVKIKTVTANHRANDIIVADGDDVVLRARFTYGPLDMVILTGEKVDIYMMKDPPAGEWTQIASELTDKNGRVSFTLSKDTPLTYGIYPVKMIVKGDHTCADFYCAVVPPKTECVVFSIDGSFTASMSVTGSDPKVRAGAVDVVRHWQELGYLIIYVTGRPDMQHHKVVAWLAQHNFPTGLVSFADGLSTDFLGHKTEYLRSLVQDHKLLIHAAYGSSKDINVYANLDISPEKIFVVGKVAKKQQTFATVLFEGYAAHLSLLQAHGGSRPAQGNARMVIPRGYFGLSGQPISIGRRRSAKRTTSFPGLSQSNETMSLMDPIAQGASPRRIKASMNSFAN